MYNAHRGIGQAPPPSRLTDLLDQIRQEFDSQSRTSQDAESQVQHQVQQMEDIRHTIYKLEQTHLTMKEGYEKEIERLRRELELRGGSSASVHPQSNQPHSGPSQPPPPAIGHGPSNLFGGIMAGGQGASALAPPPQDQSATQGLPVHLSQNAVMNAAGPPQHAQYGGYPPGPPVNGYGPQPPQPAASPGPGRAGGRGPPGAVTPQMRQAVPYPPSPVRAPLPTPPPGQRPGAPPHPSSQERPMLADIKPSDLPPQQKREGDEWYAVFNPDVRRLLDVNLVHTLTHSSVVCCVRFSQDGLYVATGCNRSAQIFDTRTGQLLTQLFDETAEKEGDLYIRSVCFSPDGKYLATGAEDKIIRVWDIASRTIKASFPGHEQDIYSLDFARNGRHIASGSGDRTVRIWDVETGTQVLTLSIEDGVTTVALSADGRYVAAGSLDKSVRVWDTSSGFPIERLEGPEGHKDSVYSVAFAPEGNRLVSGSLDKTIKMWDLSDPRAPQPNGPKRGKCVRTFEGHKDFVLSVALTPDGQWVLSGSKDRGVQFWDPRTGEPQLYLQGHKNSVISVAPSPIGGLFATGSGDSRARIWSYEPYRNA